jgi:quinol monooxygenase YgiN
MSLSLIVSGVGAVVAAIGLVMLLVRITRTPRGDLIAWAVALLGLLVCLAAQAVGHLAGFTGLTFRAMETGGQVIAPMALIMGLSEAVARSLPGRFAGRLLIPAFTIIPLAVFGTDPLSGTAFTKAWPAPATYYQLIPNKLLEFGLAPVTSIVAVVTVAIAIRRSRREFAWRAALIPVIAAGVAVLVLALPGLAPALRDHLGLKLPLASLFAVLCLIAAGLTWYASIGTASVPIDALRDASLRSGDDRGRYARAPRQRTARDEAGPQAADDDPYEHLYGSSGARRAGPDGDAHAGYAPGPGEPRGYGRGPYEDDYSRTGFGRDGDSGIYDNAAYDSAIYDSGSQDGADAQWRGVDQTGDMEAYREGGPGALARDAPARDRAPDSGYAGPRTGDVAAAPGPLSAAVSPSAAAGPAPAGPAPAGPADAARREELFGQIAIYTLIEDQTENFDRLTERVVSQVRSGEPSTLVYIVHAVPSAPLQRILYEVYRDRAAYEQHLRQPYVSQFEADRRPHVLATNVIELGLQHAKVSPFPSIADLFGEPGYDTSGFERPDFTREYGSTVRGVAGTGAGGPASSGVAGGGVAGGGTGSGGVGSGAAAGPEGAPRPGRRRATGTGPAGR